MEKYVGPVAHVSRILPTNRNDDLLSINIGFVYDEHALKYIDGHPGNLEIAYERDVITFTPVAT